VTTTADVVIIGGGVIGCSIALDLSRRGHRVVVVDKGPAAGAGSTSASSAIVRFHYSTRPGVVASWESGQRWKAWRDHLGVDDPDGLARFHQVGVVVIDPPGADHSKTLALFDDVGVPYEEWDTAALAAHVPALDTGRYWPPRKVDDPHFADPPDGELSAYFTPDGGFVDDPQLAAHNLMTAAKQSGAEFRFKTLVTAVPVAGGRIAGVELAGGDRLSAPVVINAAGPYSNRVNELAGVLADFEVSTRPMRQEVHVVPGPDGFRLGEGATMVSDADLGTYFRPQPGGTLLVGGLEPECDPLVWLDDPDALEDHPTVDVWEAQVYRLARRLPALDVPSRPVGLAALYDVTPDWVPIYDRTSLDGFYVAIGTSGNQFKNAPFVGNLMADLVEACEAGHDHDRKPVQVPCALTGQTLDLGHFSRRREIQETSFSVLG
jgi:glycine/D-amino acid oxidase-like deaminating enzyme